MASPATVSHEDDNASSVTVLVDRSSFKEHTLAKVLISSPARAGHRAQMRQVFDQTWSARSREVQGMQYSGDIFEKCEAPQTFPTPNRSNDNMSHTATLSRAALCGDVEVLNHRSAELGPSTPRTRPSNVDQADTRNKGLREPTGLRLVNLNRAALTPVSRTISQRDRHTEAIVDQRSPDTAVSDDVFGPCQDVKRPVQNQPVFDVLALNKPQNSDNILPRPSSTLAGEISSWTVCQRLVSIKRHQERSALRDEPLEAHLQPSPSFAYESDEWTDDEYFFPNQYRPTPRTRLLGETLRHDMASQRNVETSNADWRALQELLATTQQDSPRQASPSLDLNIPAQQSIHETVQAQTALIDEDPTKQRKTAQAAT